MLEELYDALKEVGASEEKARAASIGKYRSQFLQSAVHNWRLHELLFKMFT